MKKSDNSNKSYTYGHMYNVQNAGIGECTYFLQF